LSEVAITFCFAFSSSLGSLKEKYPVSNIDPKNAFVSISLAEDILDAAFDSAFGMTEMEDAPVPPKTDPRIKTLGLSPSEASISLLINLRISLWSFVSTSLIIDGAYVSLCTITML